MTACTSYMARYQVLLTITIHSHIDCVEFLPIGVNNIVFSSHMRLQCKLSTSSTFYSCVISFPLSSYFLRLCVATCHVIFACSMCISVGCAVIMKGKCYKTSNIMWPQKNTITSGANNRKWLRVGWKEVLTCSFIPQYSWGILPNVAETEKWFQYIVL